MKVVEHYGSTRSERGKPMDVAYIELLDAGPNYPSQRYRTKLTHQNGNDLFISSEGYTDADEAMRQAKKAFGGEYEVRVR